MRALCAPLKRIEYQPHKSQTTFQNQCPALIIFGSDNPFVRPKHDSPPMHWAHHYKAKNSAYEATAHYLKRRWAWVQIRFSFRSLRHHAAEQSHAGHLHHACIVRSSEGCFTVEPHTRTFAQLTISHVAGVGAHTPHTHSLVFTGVSVCALCEV